MLKKIFLLGLFFSSSVHAVSFDQLIGVDYQPNHYSVNNAFNFHDVFFVGNNAGTGITNVYAELIQLKQAGFTTVRSYQTTAYSWIDIINQAHALGMKVIYEAVIPQQPADSPYNGGCPVLPTNQDYIPCAQSLLNTVITQVTKPVFNDTVILVLAGHENYCEQGNVIAPCNNAGVSNVNYLISAVDALKSTLSTAGLATPVSSALVSGNLVTPSTAISNDMISLFSHYSSDAPLAFDPYPFQWGVVAAATAVWGQPLSSATQLVDSLAWDYLNVVGSTTPPALPTAPQQPFYTSGRVLMAAETGWATAGTTTGYACNQPGPCTPSVANAVLYYQTLYQANTANFVTSSGYKNSILAFEAYDEPSKGSSSAEGNYGLFDTNCNQKAAGLVPNNIMVASTGCQGFSSGALLTIVGFGHPYTLAITQTNPITHKDASITMTSTGNPGPLPDSPWAKYLVFPGANITIRGSTSCTSTVQSINSSQQITFSNGACNCTNDNLNNCYY
jgi:hypothetical protein